MNLAFLPDLFALAVLIAILLMVRRRHAEERADAWLLGLIITLLEGIAHIFYAPHGMPSSVLHVIVVDCYLLAGLVFVWASGDQRIPRGQRFLFLALNAVPLFALITPYGLNLRTPHAYIPAIAFGTMVGVGSSLLLRNNWRYAALHVAGWCAVAVLVSKGNFRQAVYWALACVYAIAALNFQRRLERRSTGKLAIVTGFAIWSLFFLTHPWIVTYAAYTDIASHLWNMQKALISIGMILVMLEKQASSNEWLALHDELTGLPNRRLFATRLTEAIQRADRRGNRLALVVVDLNGFKHINDTLGHLAGDTVLREVAATLRHNVRTADTVARLGGDEFIIVAGDMAAHGAVERFADGLRSAIETPILIGGQPTRITASLGIAVYPDDARDATRLLRLADQRMYAFKKNPQRAHLETTLARLAPPA